MRSSPEGYYNSDVTEGDSLTIVPHPRAVFFLFCPHGKWPSLIFVTFHLQPLFFVLEKMRTDGIDETLYRNYVSLIYHKEKNNCMADTE